MTQSTRIHPLDKLITDDSLFLLEAMVPFIEFPYKKMLILFIKYRELISILKCLDDKDYLSSCGFDCHPKSTEDMINDMCGFLPENVSGSIKQMKQMMGMMDMMNSMGENPLNNMFNNTYQSSNLFDSVISILDNDNKE